MSSKRKSRRWWAGQLVAFVAFAIGVATVGGFLAGSAKADPNEVLILSPTVSGGASSVEAMAAAALGYGADVVDATTWAGMTTADFANYRAIILGDPTCGSVGAIAAAEANRATWGPAIDGNVVMNGTDPVFHQSQGGAQLTQSSIAFAVDAAGKTGMYISLSCYYHGTAPNTAVPLLDPFGTFTVTGVGCYNDAHIVASHPALGGLTDADLSNWSCSVHEAFDSWPTSGAGAFTVLAIAEGAGTTYTAPDGSVGIPYILARGEGLAAGDISLNPPTGTAAADGVTQQCMTALITSGGTPQSGKTVSFSIVSGPNAGLALANGVTDATGSVERCYTSTLTGIDTIEASFTENGRTQTSNQVTREWTGGPPPPRVNVDGKGQFNSGTGRVLFELSNTSVAIERLRGGRFTFTGSVSSVVGSGNDATLTGTGTYNGTGGHTFTIVVEDNGAPGANKDKINVVIRDAANAVVFTSNGDELLKSGNIVVTTLAPPA